MSGELKLKLTANGFPGCDTYVRTAPRQRPTAPPGRATRQTYRHRATGADKQAAAKKKNNNNNKKKEKIKKEDEDAAQSQPGYRSQCRNVPNSYQRGWYSDPGPAFQGETSNCRRRSDAVRLRAPGFDSSPCPSPTRFLPSLRPLMTITYITSLL